MSKNLLAAFGLLTLVVLAATAVAGLLIVKDRVRIVVTQDETGERPDPTALLRDDLQTVGKDVAALTQALGENFERLAGALEAAADRRHAEVMALRQELTAVRQTLTAQAGQDQALQGKVTMIGERIANLAAAVAAAPATPVQPAAVPPGEPAPLPPTATEPPTTAPASPEPVGVTPPQQPATQKPAGFLGFQVGGARFRFDALQRYSIIPELSRVGFDAKSTLHDFSGVTSKVIGEFVADFDDPQGAWTGRVTCEAATLATGVDGRDTAMREHLDTGHHAEIVFALQKFEAAKDGIDVGKQTAQGEVIGTMTIRGKDQPLRMPVTITVDASRRVVIEGQVPLKLSDYGVPVPSQLGLINMQDEVKVWIALRARVRQESR
ncbi:MAG: YceI family protein [Planctomycetes bacterium]|nr:YceI family protein [Planctomycetota bacterium]